MSILYGFFYSLFSIWWDVIYEIGACFTAKIYTAVFAALLGLTLTTTAVSLIDLGSLNVVVAPTIAIGKALLVLLYFMHLRYSSRLTWVFAGAGFFWLAILITLITSDVLTRN